MEDDSDYDYETRMISEKVGLNIRVQGVKDSSEILGNKHLNP